MRFSVRPLTLLTLVFAQTFSYVATAAGKEMSPAPLEFSNYGNWAGDLGSGYNYRSNAFTGFTCVDGVTVELGRPESNLDFSMAVDNQLLKKELGIEGDVRTIVGPGEVSAGAKYLKASTEDSFSITLNYVGTFKFTNRFLKNPKLNETGKSVARLESLLEQNCGQGFVQQVVRGAKLFISIRFDFTSRDDKESFKAQMDYRSPLLDVSAGVKTKTENFSKRSQVTVSAYQIGGEVEKLAYVFQGAATNGVQKEENATYAFISCSFGEMEQCKRVLANAVHYATDRSDKESFPHQVNSNNEATSKLFANLSYLIVPNAFPELVRIPGLNVAVEEQKRRLYTYLIDNVEDLNKIQNLQSGKVEYSSSQIEVFKRGERVLRERQAKMLETAIYCYQQDEQGCGTKVAELNVQLETLAFDKSILSPLPVTFGQFCSSAHASEPKFLDKRARESVYAIEESVAKNPDYKNKLDAISYFAKEKDAVDRCVLMDRFLKTQSHLDLSYKEEAFKISSLEPLRNLTKLQSLSLENQKVEDVSLLEAMTDLETLNLSGNAVKDIAPLSRLGQLRELRVARNRLRSVAELEKAPALEYLDVRSNLPSVECISSESLKQCLLTQSKWMISFTPAVNSRGYQAVLPQATETREAFTLTGILHGLDLSSTIQMTKSGPDQGYAKPGGNTMAGHVWGANVALNDDQILITGGWPYNSLTVVEIYDAKRGNHLSVGSMRQGRAGHTATKLKGNSVLVAGGYYSLSALSTDEAVHTAEILSIGEDVSVQSVQSLNMRNARGWQTATELASGKIAFIGGFAGGRAVGSIEVFDPETKSFQIVGQLAHPRGGHTITALGDEKFLVIGGFKDPTTALNSAEIFDGRTYKTRLVRGTLSEGRGLHSALRLENGEVLVLGGMTKVNGTSDQPDGLNLIRVLSSTIEFNRTTEKKTAVCSVCLDTVETFVPGEESFLSNPALMSVKRAGAAVMSSVAEAGPLSFNIWGGLDESSSQSIDSSVVIEDPLK